MSRKVCAKCPFIPGSGMGYDADAMEALESGMTPSCHMIVGPDAIFHIEPPSAETVCIGHELWCADVRGFHLPTTIGEPA